MIKIGLVIDAMTEFYTGDVDRINHFLKVYGFAKMIGELEGLEEDTQEILEVTALVHDIGIRISEEKYNSSAGTYQELEGPPVAEEMLGKLGYRKELIDRVSYLVGHHHTYSKIDGMDYQILVEADFLVNIHENGIKKREVEQIRKKIFKTRTGLALLDRLYQKLSL